MAMGLTLRKVSAGLALLSLTACVSGTVLGEKANCTGSTALVTQVTGDCERTIERLTAADTQHIAVQTSDVTPYASVDFEVSVQSGTVSVAFTDAQGQRQTAEAVPGRPAAGSVRVRLDPLNQIKFDLTPMGGPASGVKYHVRFVCDCLP